MNTATTKKQPPGNLRDLPHVQQKLVCWIHGYFSQHKHAPSDREIMMELSLTVGALQYHLGLLEKAGWISRTAGQHRNIRLWFQTSLKASKTVL